MNIEIRKKDLLIYLTTLILMFTVSCKKEQSIEIKDFREKYYGDFNFKVIKELWSLGDPVTYDTSYYAGIIRKYELIDSDSDLYTDYVEENPIAKITIEFNQNTKITSQINEDGILTPKSGYHYSHKGEFVDIDTIKFYVDRLGGLGGGRNYDVIGIRIK